MTGDTNDDMLAERLFEAARLERPEPATRRRAFRALSEPRPQPAKPRWLVAALTLSALGALFTFVTEFGSSPGDGARGGPEFGAIQAEPVAVPSRSVGAAARPRDVDSQRKTEATATVVRPAPPGSVSSAASSGEVLRRSTPRPLPASLERELELLDAARQALLAGDTAAALERWEQYDRAATRRHLGAEATVLRIQILAASGRAAEASALAIQFVATHPNSPLVDRAKGFIRESQWGDVNQGVGP